MLRLALVSLLLSGCGAAFNDSTVEIGVNAGSDVRLELDGMPISVGRVTVDNHRDHVVIGRHADGTIVGRCDIHATVGVGYVVADVIFLEVVAPIVVDLATGDWKSVETTGCSL